MFRNGKKEETQPSLPVEPPATVADLRKQVEQLKADLQTERGKCETLFTKLHGKQAEVEEASEDSKRLRSILRAEKINFQNLAEISKKCIDKGILPAHKWDQQARVEVYSTAAKMIEEAINPTVTAPPPREGLLKAHQQIADYMNQAAKELTGEDVVSGPGIEKGHEFPPVPCPFCNKEPAKNWLSRHIKEEHPRRYDKWEREREESE
jgi:hypothetical protein